MFEARRVSDARRGQGRCLARGCFAALLGAACGGSATAEPPVAPRAPLADATADAADSEVSASAEIGGLDQQATEESFRSSLDALQACVSDGVERVEFMGGSIEFAVEVDAERRAARVWAAHSSLGERATEKCMFDALRAVAWPAPRGGPLGIARSSFEFETRKGAPEPAAWDAGRVAHVVDDMHSRLSECGEGPLDGLLITLYIGADGRALAGGAATETPREEGEVDCVVDTLLGARYPRPERTPAKVRFRL